MSLILALKRLFDYTFLLFCDVFVLLYSVIHVLEHFKTKKIFVFRLSETNLQEKISAKFTLESETSPRSLRVGEIASHKCELYNNMYPWHQD